ncbi:MAG: CCA tRNA nucleotidyltransferase [Clostridia bacterium]|nr:CCA tRNA nucleotidyltransferase [Clostridia bacterium]
MISDKNAEKLIEIIEKADFEAYAVGGCVRDALMGRKTNDYDITTSATPMQTESVLLQNGIRFVETGIKHGTVSAIMDGSPYEITTFRTECGYSDNRHPDKVEFVSSLREDLSRRDFTVNAMAYNSRCGLVDMFGGRQDLENKTLRTVGSPDKRFGEDALRILRALRFSSTLDFDIEKETALSISRNFRLIENVANERITAEMLKLIEGTRFSQQLLNYPELFAHIFDLKLEKFTKHAQIEAAEFVEKSPKNIVFILAFLQKYKDTEKFDKNAPFGRLKLPAETVRRTLELTESLNIDLPRTETELTLLLSKKGERLIFDLSDFKGDSEARKITERIILEKRPYLVSHLEVTGKDVMQLGITGKDVGNALSDALYAVITGKVQNTKRSIIEYIKAR